jgi:hypothetical protein
MAKARQAQEALVFLFVGALHRAEITGLALEQRQVVEKWSSPEATPRESSNGFGGWMTTLLISCAALALWGDSFLP